MGGGLADLNSSSSDAPSAVSESLSRRPPAAAAAASSHCCEHDHDHGSHDHGHSHSHHEQQQHPTNQQLIPGKKPTLIPLSKSAADAVAAAAPSGGPVSVQLDAFGAVKLGHFPAFTTLCDAVRDVRDLEVCSPEGHTLMHWSAKCQDTRFIEYLADRGCRLDVPSRDSVGMHPIHWACTENAIGVASLLVRRGVSVDCRDASGCTPLLIASQYGHDMLVAFLVKRGADVEILDNSGDSAMHWAAYKGNVQIVGLLQHLHLETDKQDVFGQTPLHLAALRGNHEVVSYLIIDAGSTAANLPDKEGKTPLMLAEKKGGTASPNGKAACELMLKEYISRAALITSCPALKPFEGCLAAMPPVSVECLKSPRTWLHVGKNFLTGNSRSQEHQKWPFFFVIFNMTLGGLLYPTRVFAEDPDDPEGGAVLGDCAFLHLWTLTFMAGMWACFFGCYLVDPGAIDKKSKNPQLAGLHAKLHAGYETALEALGAETSNDGRNKADSSKVPPLCHSCHIVRPLRSKHCRVTRKCVLVFDHYCPFLGNAIGLYNYKFFWGYMINHTLCVVGYIITCCLYLSRSGFDALVAFLLVWIGLNIIPGLGMGAYHFTLTRRNLTTNEHSNLFKYKYLQDELGRYANPFDQGIMHNIYVRFFPSDEAYELPADKAARITKIKGRDEEGLLNSMV